MQNGTNCIPDELRQELLRFQQLTATNGKTLSEGSPVAGGGLLPVLQNLDRICREQKEALPPQLSHYLERRSYQKALQWVEEQAVVSHGEGVS